MTPNMPSSGRVDVLAVLDRYLKEVLPGKLWDGANRYCNQLGFADSEYSRDMAKLVEARAAVAELIEADKRWQAVRKYASGDDFDRWEEMARGGHIPSDDGNRYADLRADALANIGAAP